MSLEIDAGGSILPSGVSSPQQGRRIRIEQEKRAILQEKGMSLPGRPEDTSLLGGYGTGYLSWITNGNLGVKLEPITLGGGIFTSFEAPERIVRRLNEEDPEVVTTRRRKQEKREAFEKACRRFDR